MDARTAGVTVRVVLPVMPPDIAEIEVEPTVAAVARPWEPEALLMDATVVDDEAHVAVAVRSCVELSV